MIPRTIIAASPVSSTSVAQSALVAVSPLYNCLSNYNQTFILKRSQNLNTGSVELAGPYSPKDVIPFLAALLLDQVKANAADPTLCSLRHITEEEYKSSVPAQSQGPVDEEDDGPDDDHKDEDMESDQKKQKRQRKRKDVDQGRKGPGKGGGAASGSGKGGAGNSEGSDIEKTEIGSGMGGKGTKRYLWDAGVRLSAVHTIPSSPKIQFLLACTDHARL
jgi:hypothetical protein